MSHGHAPPPTEFQLPNAPADGISSLTFSPTQPDRLLVTSWDKTIRLYDVSQPVLLGQYETAAAVLDACFAGTSPKRIYSGGLDPVVRGWDIETRTQVSLGTHEAPVKCVKFADAHGVVVTGSWDKTVGLWDPRASAATAVGRYMQPERVFSLDVVDHTIVVAMAGRHVFLYDIRNMKETLQRRESSLKYMTRAVRCMPDGRGYVTSSIEGRVAVEFFDPAPAAQAHKYAFKCHRQVVQGVDVVYPVNALAFHPTQGTFASGGSDGIVNIWDGFNKKRLRQYPKYPASISALAFNCTGNWLAIASSYTYDEGEKEHPADAIFIRPISESEVRPKLPHPKA
ncbi:WD40-repeat-containing domain protein [Dimargaris cristalligena]|uniref:WD40-repeat-containing domain protein n=1 Tax=Dimargaris cristalligena TaxID=215637 RepID=A0A4P9ZUG3_9FUNG|nr:WD40-repeat-containing domain protein [Dimargaris cristalligena]|eukprot:RKP36432.1 WD40-repeat-containing domain protein [Dimargaris cristalligena]